MTQAIVDALAPYCPSPPDDLVSHFATIDRPAAPALSINVLDLPQAIEYTDGIQQHAILGEPFGLIALEDANNSNPYCYITKGPTRGAVMSLCHDGDSGIAFASLEAFCTAIDTAIRRDTDIYDLKHDRELMALDRGSIASHVQQLAANDGLVEEICVLVPLIRTSNLELITSLASHSDFFVREAVAVHIADSPGVELLPVAQSLATDQHPQVARPGARALSAVKRVIHSS